MIPLNRYTIGATVAVILIGAAWFGIVRWEANIRADVREEVAAEQLAEDLAQTRADLEFQRDQTAKSETAVQELRSDLSDMAARVQASRVTIRERIVKGELPNGMISPVKEATIDQIETLERERVSAESLP